ncbi:MAG: DUF11 domain-containing protein, partial [Thermoplasmata archaeon]|nr:DUF11 domain-containing protein [Thermoplasmata archaeon]
AWDGSGVPPTVGNNWLIGGVPGNSNGTLFINVSVGIGVLPGTILTNTVNFEYNDQSVLQTGSASANTLVVNPDVTITKTGPAVIYSGQVISYTITYQNNGDDYAYDLNITDTFPADIAYTGSIPAPDFGAPGSPACTWLINSVPPGGIGTIIVNGLVNALAPVDTVLENYVWLNYTNAAGAGFSDQDMVTTVVVGDIVTLDKTGPLTADPGETIFYNISYNNEATSAGPVNIVITEFYDNVTFVGSVPVPSNPGAGDNIWIIPNVAPDSGGIITITVTVNNTAPDIITNQVMLSYITGTTDVFLNATATTVISGPLMEITKTGPDDAVPGNTIMYTITYTNVGAGFANNVTITEIYPSMTSFNFALPAPNPGTDNVWTLGAIAPGDSFTIRIWVDISASAFGTLTNWAELTYQNMSGGSLPSEWASAATVLTGPTLTLVKSGPDTINSGQQITYTLTYNNIGRADASDVILEDAYPAGLVYVSSSDGGIDMGGYVVWYLPDVPVGTGGTVTVTFDVGYAKFDTFMNSAYLNYSDQSGTNDYYSADFYNTTVLDPLMTVSKWATPVANSGQLITYWINYSNPAGIFAQPAYNVVITETYDLANVVFISSIPAPSIGDNIWNLGTQMPGNSSSIMITVMVLPGTANDTWITNIVEMTFENSAMAMPPVQDSAQTYILNPELSIVKFGPATANTGETITYTIWVNNTGGAMAQNVVITETYPGELTFLDAFPLPDIGDNVWLIGDMAAQTSVMITITLQVNDGTSGLTATNDVAV